MQNISDEFHNFHVHQSKFAVTEISGGADVTRGTVLHDNLPIPPGEWIKIRVRFDDTVVGRFVYHCHILEPEDKGMMSVMEVVPTYERKGALETIRNLFRTRPGQVAERGNGPAGICCSDA